MLINIEGINIILSEISSFNRVVGSDNYTLGYEIYMKNGQRYYFSNYNGSWIDIENTIVNAFKRLNQST